MATEVKAPSNPNIMAFNKWNTDGIVVEDLGLQRYIITQARIVPKTGARYAGHNFHKSKVFIVERLINKVMNPGTKSGKHWHSSGHMTGMATQAYDIVKGAFEIVEQKTKENPVKVFVRALENAAPREEIVTIEYGGARYPKAVECAPQRRIDIALRYFTQGAYSKSFNSKMAIENALADEIISAFRLDAKSLAIQKKLELERQADASR
jgi:small subunit ribosomal protein S7